jgi:NADH-quinone oxidoreductase subunit M
MNQLGFPFLTIIIFLPLAGGLALLFFGRGVDRIIIRHVALLFAAVDFFLCLILLVNFDRTTAQMQFVDHYRWIPSIGASYYVGVDGISILFMLLTALLGLLAIFSSWSAVTQREHGYYASFLILQTGMLGVFAALDFFLFYIFWEVTLVPMYFIIGLWGGPDRLYAAIKFIIFTLSGSVFMLLGILGMCFSHYHMTGQFTFDIQKLYSVIAPTPVKVWIALALFVGFAVKVPLFPLHTWLPDAHVEAPTAGSVLLAGILLKMGGYGFVRFILPLVPTIQDSAFWLECVRIIAVIGIVYGAFLALAQTDIKKLVAYSSISHLGMVTLGIFALNSQGIEGGILQMVNHGLTTGGLFLLVGVIYERRHTRDMDAFGGLARQMPFYATVFMIVMLGAIGVPGLNGFVGEFLILVGAFKVSVATAALMVAGIFVGTIYMLRLYQKMMFGPLDKKENQALSDLDQREMAYLAPIVIFVFWIGLYPRAFLDIMHVSVGKLAGGL